MTDRHSTSGESIFSWKFRTNVWSLRDDHNIECLFTFNRRSTFFTLYYEDQRWNQGYVNFWLEYCGRLEVCTRIKWERFHWIPEEIKKFCSLILLIYRHELILSIKFIDWNDVIASRHFVMVISVIALNKFKYSKRSNNNCRFLVYESLKGARISHWDMALCVNLHFTNKNKSETQRNITWKMRRFLLKFLIIKRK